MKTNTFVSFSFENENLSLVQKIINVLENTGSIVDYSEKEDRSTCSDKIIWEKLLTRIHGSSVTLLVLTKDLLEKNRYKISSGKNFEDSGWVYKEISASLRDWKNNSINGVLVVYDDKIENLLSNRSYKISKIIDFNRKNKRINNMYSKDYIELVSSSLFKQNPMKYIQNAKSKREEQRKNESYVIKYDFHN